MQPWMIIHLRAPLPSRFSCQPGPSGLKQPCERYPRLRGDQPRAGPLFGIAPGGACHAGSVARAAVRSYRTFSPLPRIKPRAVCSLWRFPSGCPGRVLPGTNVSWSPDFPRSGTDPARDHPAIRATCNLGARSGLVNGEACRKVTDQRDVSRF